MRNYATVSMDSGHWGASLADGRWAYNSLVVKFEFGLVNEADGIYGRQLILVAADDGYEPARTGTPCGNCATRTMFSICMANG
jgi:hypothetical protein